MLMKVVLPAPLVPIRPTTESLSMAALMSLAAVTAPKFLLRPCASRIAAISGRLAPPEQRPQAVRQEHDDRSNEPPSTICQVLGETPKATVWMMPKMTAPRNGAITLPVPARMV